MNIVVRHAMNPRTCVHGSIANVKGINKRKS